MIWEKAGKTVHANGEAEILYTPKLSGSYLVIFGGLHVESRKRAIEHSGRSGYWMHTSYFVVNPEAGTEHEYASLKDAEAAAEALIREDDDTIPQF